jgi:Fe2+ or Zn2+ uptake regulation protein
MRRAARKRTTRQLEQVFKALQGDHTHPFAHEIYQRVHKKLPRISLATVYRNLHSLVDEGKIRTSSWTNREPDSIPRPASTIISSASDAVEWSTCSCAKLDRSI